MTKLVDLPDIEKVQDTIFELYRLEQELGKVKLAIKLKEADVVNLVANNPQYFKNGKPLPISQIQATYAITGLNNELSKLRAKLVELESEVNYKSRQLDLYKMIADLWRTQSANERKA